MFFKELFVKMGNGGMPGLHLEDTEVGIGESHEDFFMEFCLFAPLRDD